MPSTKRIMLVLCTIDATKRAEFTHYVSHARPIFAANGGRPVGQYEMEAHIVGDGALTHAIAMEFPSAEAIESVFADPAYQALIPARTAAFPSLQILVAKEFDPAAMLLGAS